MKRFYKAVSVEQAANGWCALLDGREIKTPGGAAQIVPTRNLAEAMSGEWAGQGEEIEIAAFRLRDLADFAIDGVAKDRATHVRELAAYADTDTLCYRGDQSDSLHDRQVELWEPLLVTAEQRWDVRFERISGIIHRPQPAGTLQRMENVLASESEFTLAALRMLTSLSASLIIALHAITPDADAEMLWRAANLEEDWQAELWGRDAEAEAVRQTRLEAFRVAMQFAALARTS